MGFPLTNTINRKQKYFFYLFALITDRMNGVCVYYGMEYINVKLGSGKIMSKRMLFSNIKFKEKKTFKFNFKAFFKRSKVFGK